MADQLGSGLMPSHYTVYNKGNATTLDFNNLKELSRLYCSYRSTNGPKAGGYYWGIFNIGWDSGHFVQFACGSFDSAFIAIYARAFCGNSVWTAWHKILEA